MFDTDVNRVFYHVKNTERGKYAYKCKQKLHVDSYRNTVRHLSLSRGANEDSGVLEYGAVCIGAYVPKFQRQCWFYMQSSLLVRHCWILLSLKLKKKSINTKKIVHWLLRRSKACICYCYFGKLDHKLCSKKPMIKSKSKCIYYQIQHINPHIRYRSTEHKISKNLGAT
jgi:hypothetical protein